MSVDAAICARHSKDLIVGECKDGPTWSSAHLRLDYWVLRRSWTRPAMIGYEVKSSRQDFVRDEKWTGYLPLCNELWFVMQKPGIIQPEELPESVGLLRLAGSRLITVRKAVWRDIEPPFSLFLYILICRAKVERESAPQDQTEMWRDRLAEREAGKLVGRAASKAIRELYAQNVERVDRRIRELEEENRALSALKDALADKGIEWRLYLTANEIEQLLTVGRWDRSTVEQAHGILGKLLGNGAEAASRASS